MALAATVLSPAVGASASSLHPKGLSASLVDGTVTLSWTAPIDDAGSVTGYQVLRRRPGVDAVGTFHVVAEDTASAETSFVDRCADQANTKYTYRVKARRGEQLSRWGNYSRVDLAADYVSADPQTGCDPDTGAPPTDPDPGNSDDGVNGDGDPDGGEGVVADSAVSVKSDANDQQNNKQIVPTPDEDEGESVVPRSSLQNTDSAQFQDRSELSGLPASYPNALGRVGHGIESSTFLATFTYKHFWPRDVTASLTSDGITLTWRNPNQGAACAEYERVPGTRTLKKVTHPSGYNTWEVTETGGGFRCIDYREIQGFEIYRTSFGHVHRGGGTVELLSDSQPYLIGTVLAYTTRFTDRSHDALVGPRRHTYQIRALYATGGNIVGGNIVIDRDFGSHLSEGAHAFRERDAARPDAQSPRNLTISIPTKQAVHDGATLAINLAWHVPSQDSGSVTGYVVQRRLVTQSDRALPFADIATTGHGATSWADTSSDVTTTVSRSGTAYPEIAPLTQFSYRVIAVRGTDRSNPSAAASTDSERQLPAAGLLTVTDTWRTGATIRVNMTGTGLSDHAKHHLALAGPRAAPENRLLHVGIGATGWGHNTCIGSPDTTDTTNKVTVTPTFVEIGPGSTATYTVTLEDVPNSVVRMRLALHIDNRIRINGISEAFLTFSPADAVNGKITKTVTVSALAGSSANYAGWISHTVIDAQSDNAYHGLSIDPVMVVVSDDEGPYGYQAAQGRYLDPISNCTHTDDAYVTVSGLQPGTAYTAEALFRLISEEQYIGGQGAGVKPENFIPTWDGGFYPGGIWSPAHLVGTVTFTTDP